MIEKLKDKKNLFKILAAVLVPVIILLIPSTVFDSGGLPVVQHRVIALFAFAALMWILEPVPVYATSLLIIFIELLFISDASFVLFRSEAQNFGQAVSYKDIFSSFGSPIIILFLGGFFLAIASTKYGLDKNLARIMLRPFGNNPKYLLLGVMLITALFSMFMSNTATTAMMLTIISPLLLAIPAEGGGRTAFALSVPVAANIGGIGTPIGTPPNAIAMKYLIGENAISFGGWMAFAVPFVIVLLAIAWFLLQFLFPIKQEKVELKLDGKFSLDKKSIIVYVTFGLTILLWLSGRLHRLNSYTVAMLPIAVFTLSGILKKEDFGKISWDVLWLISGGFALGKALEGSGLAENLIRDIPFGNFSPIIIIAIASLICLFMANFMSHTATANLLLPIMAVLGSSVAALELVGGAKLLVLSVTFAASLGMSLPISTPPNALAYAGGNIRQSQMARVGVIIGAVGLIMTFGLMFILKQLSFFA